MSLLQINHNSLQMLVVRAQHFCSHENRFFQQKPRFYKQNYKSLIQLNVDLLGGFAIQIIQNRDHSKHESLINSRLHQGMVDFSDCHRLNLSRTLHLLNQKENKIKDLKSQTSMQSVPPKTIKIQKKKASIVIIYCDGAHVDKDSNKLELGCIAHP